MAPTWSTPLSLVSLLVCGAALVHAGTRLSRVVDRLADRLGMGEAIAGAVLLGATTSLSGLTASVVAAGSGEADLAVSNSVGGIAAQTTFLVVADLLHRGVNLEHAAASLPNVLQSTVLVALIGTVLLAAGSPDVTVAGVHPTTIVLPVAYLYGLSLVRAARRAPMWTPERTPETVEDVPDQAARAASLRRLWTSFAVLAALTASAGWVVAVAGLSLADRTGLSASFVGAIVTAVVTSLPELVTAMAAVRIGALTLAVGDIIGGNTFDVLFVAAADVAYRSGSVYHAIGPDTVFVLALAVLLTAVLGAGLVTRDRRGVGFEGVAILVIYGLGVAMLAS